MWVSKQLFRSVQQLLGRGTGNPKVWRFAIGLFSPSSCSREIPTKSDKLKRVHHPSKLQAAHTWCCLISRLTWSMLSVVCTTVYRPDGTGMASPWPPCLRVFLMPMLWVGARIMPVCMWDSLSSVLFSPSIFIRRIYISRFKLYNFWSIIWLFFFIFMI